MTMWSDLGEFIVNQCIDQLKTNDQLTDNDSFKIRNNKNNKSNNNSNNSNNNISNITNINKNNKNDIISNSSCKVVEIAIGKFFGVSDYLTDCVNINFISTDIDPGRNDVIFDDITDPNMDIYKDARIIYSIRPPQELQSYIGDIAKEVGAKLIIKPLFNEDLTVNFNMDIVNYKKASFYQGQFINKI